jgi:hypothetical protein
MNESLREIQSLSDMLITISVYLQRPPDKMLTGK